MVAPRVNDGPPLKRRRKTAGMPPPPRAANGGAGVFPGMQGVLSTPATLAYLSSLDGSGGGGSESQHQQMQDMLRLQDIEYEAQMGGGAAAGAGGGVPMYRCTSSTLSLSGLPLSASFSDLGDSSLAEMLKSNSFGGGGATLAGLDMSTTNSFGLASGMPIAKTRAKNASEMSLGTFLENTGGSDLNDILNEFGTGGGGA